MMLRSLPFTAATLAVGVLTLTSCSQQEEAKVIAKTAEVAATESTADVAKYSPGETSGEFLYPADPRHATKIGYEEFNASQDKQLNDAAAECMSKAGFKESPQLGQSDSNSKRDEMAYYFDTKAADASYRAAFGYGVTWSLTSAEAFNAEVRLSKEYDTAEAAAVAGLTAEQKAERERVSSDCDTAAFDDVVPEELNDWDRLVAALPAAKDSEAALSGAKAWAQCLSDAIEPDFKAKDIDSSSDGSPESMLVVKSRPLYDAGASVVGSQEALDLIALEKQWAEADWSCREKHYNGPLIDARRASQLEFLKENADLLTRLTAALKS